MTPQDNPGEQPEAVAPAARTSPSRESSSLPPGPFGSNDYGAGYLPPVPGEAPEASAQRFAKLFEEASGVNLDPRLITVYGVCVFVEDPSDEERWLDAEPETPGAFEVVVLDITEAESEASW